MLFIFTVDSFTDKMFSGNPAGVCLLDEREFDDSVLQSIAAEMNLSETAFVKKSDKGFDLRWFTPKSEVELCGHATLASAHILWQEGILKENEEAVFHTVYKGVLTAKREGKQIILDFPVNRPVEANPNSSLEKALGIRPKFVSMSDSHYVAELETAGDVRNLDPDFKLLLSLDKFGTIITSKSDDSKYDFISRFFAPAKGVNEDPVTGSAHCVLAPYWSKKLGKNVMNAFQASERGGAMKVTLAGDRVLLAGEAVTVLSGKLFL